MFRLLGRSLRFACIAAMLLTVTPLSYAEEGSDMSPYSVERRGESATTLTLRLQAPRSRVFEAMTSCDHLDHWMHAAGRNLLACAADVRTGGNYRHEFGAPNGRRFVVYGAYVEAARPARLIHTESYEGYDWSPLIVTTEFAESGAETTVTQTIEYPSAALRDEDFPNLQHALTGYGALQAHLDSLDR